VRGAKPIRRTVLPLACARQHPNERASGWPVRISLGRDPETKEYRYLYRLGSRGLDELQINLETRLPRSRYRNNHEVRSRRPRLGTSTSAERLTLVMSGNEYLRRWYWPMEPRCWRYSTARGGLLSVATAQPNLKQRRAMGRASSLSAQEIS
jgi:hypothetical protein